MNVRGLVREARAIRTDTSSRSAWYGLRRSSGHFR
jgi:hypothetical protein